MKRIFIFSKATPEELPPVMSLAMSSRDLDMEVHLITQNISDSNRKKLSDEHIHLENLINKKGSSIPGKLLHWYRYRKFAVSILKKNINGTDYIWVSGADTAISIGNKILKKYSFYLQLNELCDDEKLYLFLIRKLVKSACQIVVPEVNRAWIIQVLYKLKRRPCVLANKPHSFDAIFNEDNTIKKVLAQIKTEKSKNKLVIIYQGYITFNRNLTNLLKIAEKYKNSVTVVLMGKDEGALATYRNINPALIYISHINAPNHLLITQACDAGIIVYKPTYLNNIYCAPNKIWEYSRFGLAIIGNNIPGLNAIEEQQMGILVDIDDLEDIDNKMNTLKQRIEEFHENAVKFYNNYNYSAELLKILK